MRRSRSAWLCLFAWTCLLVRAMVSYGGTDVSKVRNSQSGSEQTLQEVTVTAHRQIDDRTLDRVIIPRFVASHGAPNPRSNQVGRWTPYLPVCPSTIGLKPAFADYVSRRVLAVAAMVGAPAARFRRCKFTVEIIFTPSPQEQVSYLAKTYRALLGYSQGIVVANASDTDSMQSPVGAWYTTATYTVGRAAGRRR